MARKRYSAEEVLEILFVGDDEDAPSSGPGSLFSEDEDHFAEGFDLHQDM